MSEEERGAPPGADDGGAELDIGALLRQAFDPAKDAYPPHFLEMTISPMELEFEIARQEWPAVEERLLRRFFASIGQDYDVWRRERRRRRWRQVGQYLLVFVSLVALALGAGAAVGPGALRGWQPGSQPHAKLTAIQPYFAIPLPMAAPAGYRLVDVGLAWSPAGTPRATLVYERLDGTTLLVRAPADEPWPVPAGWPAEQVVVAGRVARWVGAAAGGWVVWSEEGWQLGLTSATLAQSELLEIAAQLIL
jgi:hypothetical protein